MPKFNFENITAISQETFKYHWGKHYKNYIDNLNKLTEKTNSHNLVEIINTSKGALYNNAAQVWNHTFYWLCLTPKSEELESDSTLSIKIKYQFGSLDNFKAIFINKASELFGSGWTWLALNKSNGQLEIANTMNAGVIDFKKYIPLLICDDWEHAYYIDYRNARNQYLEAFWSSINWNFVEDNYKNQRTLDIDHLLHASAESSTSQSNSPIA